MIISLESRLPSVSISNSLASQKVVAQTYSNQTPEQAAVKIGKYEASSQYEPIFGEELQKLGLNPVPNYPIEQYNADLGFPEKKFAIEIDGGRFHSSDYSVLLADAKKEQCLMRNGWVIVRYSLTKQNQFLIPLYAKEIKMIYDKLALQ